MSLMLVICGGAVGAVSRYYTERWAVHRFHERVPWGTAIANLVGAVILGTIAGLAHRGAVSQDVLLLVGTGFCGALTTFSGFIGQIQTRLRHASTRALALQYGVGVIAAGIVLAGLAYHLAIL